MRQRRFDDTVPHHRPARAVLNTSSRALVDGHTIFPSRVFHASLLDRLLKSGMHSRKIGKRVMKGRWKGFPIYTLTLEERATCPRSCGEWNTCYGRGMQFAERIIHDEVFEHRLWAELEALQRRHPAGYVVRLHVLGDFYSVDYVEQWRAALDAFPALNVFGYTARLMSDPIGAALFNMAAARWERFSMRFSGAGFSTMAAEVVADAAETANLICPAQTGGTDCCATCAFCWQSQRTVAFLRH